MGLIRAVELLCEQAESIKCAHMINGAWPTLDRADEHTTEAYRYYQALIQAAKYVDQAAAVEDQANTLRQRQREILDAAVAKWGNASQFLMLSGECGELIAAINRFVVQGRCTPADVIDEIADVHLLLQQARRMLGEEVVAERINYKLQRLAERLGMTGEAA